VSVSTSGDGRFQYSDWPEKCIDKIECTTYKFFLHVKAPKFLVRSVFSWGYSGYYWELEEPETLLALLAVNKDFYEISKPIFYGENYFEVLDVGHGILQDYGSEVAGTQLAHRFYELLSWSRARGGTPRYGVRPLSLIHKINIDMELCDIGGQSPWVFDRIISILISIPHLQSLSSTSR
jgi:hypothetical protein